MVHSFRTRHDGIPIFWKAVGGVYVFILHLSFICLGNIGTRSVFLIPIEPEFRIGSAITPSPYLLFLAVLGGVIFGWSLCAYESTISRNLEILFWFVIFQPAPGSLIRSPKNLFLRRDLFRSSFLLPATYSDHSKNLHAFPEFWVISLIFTWSSQFGSGHQ